MTTVTHIPGTMTAHTDLGGPPGLNLDSLLLSAERSRGVAVTAWGVKQAPGNGAG
jgi:hypothetical protein